jgi:protein gp37
MGECRILDGMESLRRLKSNRMRLSETHFAHDSTTLLAFSSCQSLYRCATRRTRQSTTCSSRHTRKPPTRLCLTYSTATGKRGYCMAEHSKIEWTDATWNPVRGCTKISPGCAHCYAERFAERFRGVPGHPFEQGFDLRLVPQKIEEPLRWKKPKRMFVNSVSDLFHDGVPDDYIAAVADVMVQADWHTYQILTKRSGRMRDLLKTRLRFAAAKPHIWWGVSVEDKKYGLPRVAQLRSAPAARRFLSIEPLLEDLGEFNLQGIQWVIVGGESGIGARPMERKWVVSIRHRQRTRISRIRSGGNDGCVPKVQERD